MSDIKILNPDALGRPLEQRAELKNADPQCALAALEAEALDVGGTGLADT